MLDDELKRILGSRFKILGFLGDGDFGCVWKAEYIESGRVCAIKQKKFIDEDLGDVDTLFKKQFEAGIKHPNVIEIFEIISKDPESFLIMEFCDGGTLEGKLNKMRRDKQRFDEKNAGTIVQQICEGLKVIHKASYYHRDINPKNILILGDRVLIGDLGLIKKSYEKSSNVKGSGQYIPLEQQVIDKRTGLFNADSRSDLFAVGVIFYELLNWGKRPFRQARGFEELEKLKKDINYINSLSIKGISESTMAIIRKCLQPNPDDRYQTAQEMIDALEGKTEVSRHVVHVDSLYHEILNYLGRKNKYRTSAPQDVLTIINKRRSIQNYVRDHKLTGDSDIKGKLEDIDNALISKRNEDYEIMYAFAGFEKPKKDAVKEILKDPEKRDLFIVLIGDNYWDLTKKRHKNKWNNRRIRPNEKKKLYADGQDFIRMILQKS